MATTDRVCTSSIAIRCAAVCFGVLVLLSACAGVTTLREPPRISLVNIRPLDVQMFEQRFVVSLRIQNPNDSALHIDGMDYQIRLNDKRFADGVSNQQLSVAAYSEEVVDVVVSSTLLRVFEQLRSLDQLEDGIFRYGITGGINVSGLLGRIPFEYQDQLDLSGAGSGHSGKGAADSI